MSVNEESASNTAEVTNNTGNINTSNTNKEQLNESLSALVDGEASELELRRILKSNDPDVDQQWHRYQVVSHLIRGGVELHNLELHNDVNLSASISAAIADEPALSVQAKNKPSRLWSNLGRLSVAASVAGAVVIGVQFASFNSTSKLAEAPTAPVSSPVAGNPDLAPDTSVRVVGTQ
ncbi:MAG: sigma-E factor negative regulatory protein [Pseudomonadota bacterium]